MCEINPNVSFISTWNSLTYEGRVIPGMYQAEMHKDDVHLSSMGRGVLGGIWRSAISQSLNDGLQ